MRKVQSREMRKVQRRECTLPPPPFSPRHLVPSLDSTILFTLPLSTMHALHLAMQREVECGLPGAAA